MLVTRLIPKLIQLPPASALLYGPDTTQRSERDGIGNKGAFKSVIQV